MILEIQLFDGTKQNVDVGDVSEMTSDEKRTKPSKIRLEFYESAHPNQPSSDDLA